MGEGGIANDAEAGMNSVHVHLLTAHLPVLGAPFAGVLLATGFAARSESLWRAGCVALLLAAAAAAFPYFSGPPAYEVVKERSAVPLAPVERHAVVARAASLGLVLLAAVTASGLLRDFQDDPPSKPLRLAILAGAAAVAYGLGWSAHLGGLVRRPELADPPLRLFPALPDLISITGIVS